MNVTEFQTQTSNSKNLPLAIGFSKFGTKVTWNDGMTNSINADVMEMGLTRLQCRYGLHTADHCGKPYYPQYLPINVCYPSQ